MNDEVFYSQFGEDKWLIENLKLPDKGFFVDVGAGDPISLSNTYYFEKKGWKGICIECSPLQLIKLKEKRKTVVETAIGKEDGILRLYQNKNVPDISTGDTSAPEHLTHMASLPDWEIIEVPMTTLQKVLEDYKAPEIDLLSIDVEGMDIEVWESFDHEKYKPKVVIIEFFRTPTLPGYEEKMIDVFGKLPYQLVRKTFSNFIFKRL